MKRNTEYDCTSDEWGTTNNTCDLGAGSQLVVECMGTDAIFIDSVFMYYGGIKYTIEAFCISDEHSSIYMTSYSPNSCDTGYSAWDIAPLDVGEMWTTKAVYPFDLDDSDISYNALVEDASDWCIVPESCSCPTTTAPTTIPTTAPSAMMLQDVYLPLQPQWNKLLGYIDVLNDMHFEIEFTIHSWPSDLGGIIQCGTTDEEGYPVLIVSSNANNGLYVMVSDPGTSNGGFMGEALELNVTYHVEVNFTQSWLTVVMNGQTLFNDTKTAHSLHQAMPCYASNQFTSSITPADVTITNLSMWSTSTMYPTAVPTTAERMIYFVHCFNIRVVVFQCDIRLICNHYVDQPL